MIYLQITSGRGPVECVTAVRKVPDLMARDLKGSDPRDEQWKVKLDVLRQTDHSAIVALDGPDARAYADSWIGTMLWVCPSQIRKHHRRKNWFVGVREVNLPENEEILIREQDCAWETKGASSKGGQKANKGSALVRLTHTPTGIAVIAEEQRSQKQNKIIALGRLREALIQRQQDAIARIETENWTQHNQLERGNPVRTYEGPDFVER